jgi:hypothetical protein
LQSKRITTGEKKYSMHYPTTFSRTTLPVRNLSSQRLGYIFFIVILAFSRPALAVTPAPDGGYPNYNTAEGDDALFSLTTGQGNTALGNAALYFNTSGYFNTATGWDALAQNVGGHDNTANGFEAR